MHLSGTYGHVYTKYEVSMSNPGYDGCAQTMAMTTMHDGQSMIVQGPLVDKPNEPKMTPLRLVSTMTKMDAYLFKL